MPSNLEKEPPAKRLKSWDPSTAKEILEVSLAFTHQPTAMTLEPSLYERLID